MIGVRSGSRLLGRGAAGSHREVSDADNLVALCGRHHRLHHRGLLGIDGDADDPDGLVFSDVRGRRLTGSGRPAPPGQLRITGRWVHPAGERLHPRWVWFSEAPAAG